MNEKPTKILIVDDSALYRQSIHNVLRELPDVVVVGSAKNGVEALSKIEQLAPDVLTLDVQMPDMDGIQVLRELKKRRLQSNVIMVSSLTAAGAQVTTDALMEGAFDFILKPSSGDPLTNRQVLKDALASRLKAFRESQSACRARRVSLPNETATFVSDRSPQTTVPSPSSPCRLIVMGASTGGPEALKYVLPKISSELTVPILVVQHMPPKYTSTFAQRLDSICSLAVREAADNTLLERGQILLAPGGKQMKLAEGAGKLIIRITDDAAENSVRPSIDYLLRSAVEMVGADILTVIMTGMGRDGLIGCQEVSQAGGYIFAQDQSDCVVYGMPKAVIEAGLADRVLSLGKIAPAMFRHVKRSQREKSGDLH